MKPGIIIIIMIHSELHNHFSLINVTALLSFLKAAGSSINLTVHKNSLGNNNFLVDVAHTHLHTLWAQGGTLRLKIRGGGQGWLDCLGSEILVGKDISGFFKNTDLDNS